MRDGREPSHGAEDASRHVRAFDGRLLRLAVPEHRALVAHRPSTIVLADRIVVIEQGRVAETGTYASLFAAGGALTRLLARSPGGIL